MAVDFFLTDGARYAPKECKAWEDAQEAHYAYFLALDLAKMTPEEEAEAIRLKQAADKAEAEARRAFLEAIHKKNAEQTG